MLQRQFRIDDTSAWGRRYGGGSDGSFLPATSTMSPIDSACIGTNSTNSLSATNASFASGQAIAIINMWGGTGVNNWELNVISSYSGGLIITLYPLINDYGAGAQVLVLPQYSSV